MGKLNQVLAVLKGKKTRAEKTLTELHHASQRTDNFVGLSRTYTPKDDEGDRLPAENKKVVSRVRDILTSAQAPLQDYFDVVATQEWGNQTATADVEIDGKTVIADAPVTYLLFLEKQLVNLRTFVDKLPELSDSVDWTWDSNQELYVSAPVETIRSKKVPKVQVLYEATDKHPAQVQAYNEDVLVGYWKSVNFAAALSPAEKREIQARLTKLVEAVKKAREQANSLDVQEQHVSEAVFDYLWGE